jgi:hypothetical protein
MFENRFGGVPFNRSNKFERLCSEFGSVRDLKCLFEAREEFDVSLHGAADGSLQLLLFNIIHLVYILIV